jgi:hypothetical protein
MNGTVRNLLSTQVSNSLGELRPSAGQAIGEAF